MIPAGRYGIIPRVQEAEDEGLREELEKYVDASTRKA